MYTLPKIERFNQNVLSKYNIYNSVFITLPFDSIDNTGVLLPLFTEVCETGFKKQETPKEIIEFFSQKYLHSTDEQNQIDIMFRFIQFIERQIVLFDAVEDAAFPIVNNMEGRGSLRDIKEKADAKGRKDELIDFLENFNVRTVLTAHPTQFYPGSVLGIINDLTEAIRENKLLKIKHLLAQLGKTPFIKNEKPNPFDEAVSLIWYLENVFYNTSGDMVHYLQKNVFQGTSIQNPLIKLGFWPGGDRDGNPFVTTEITLKVAERLRTSILSTSLAALDGLRPPRGLASRPASKKMSRLRVTQSIRYETSAKLRLRCCVQTQPNAAVVSLRACPLLGSGNCLEVFSNNPDKFLLLLAVSAWLKSFHRLQPLHLHQRAAWPLVLRAYPRASSVRHRYSAAFRAAEVQLLAELAAQDHQLAALTGRQVQRVRRAAFVLWSRLHLENKMQDRLR